MGESSRIRKALQQSRAVRIWFWDGQREYLGEALELNVAAVTGFLKMSQFGEATVLPTPRVMEGLTKHLTGRAVEMKLSSGGLEADVKAKITGVQTDFENRRRMLVLAEFVSVSDRNRPILERLAGQLRR
jgi:hypothetical protein